MEDSTNDSKSISTSDTFDIVTKIKNSDHTIPPNSPDNVLILAGVTGSGKSTLVNYMLGKPLYSIPKKHTKLFEIVLEQNEEDAHDCIIGHTMHSQTDFPQKYTNKEKKLIIWDTPGLEDSRGAKADILNCVFINKILKNNKGAKILFIIEEGSLFGNGRSKSFKQMITRIFELFENKADLLNSVLFVFTKTGLISDYNEVLKTYINDEKTFGNEIRNFLNFIVEKQKFVMFPTPEKEGKIDDLCRQEIFQKLEGLEYLQNPKLKFIISESGLLGLNKLKNCANDEVKKEMKEIFHIVKSNFDKKPYTIDEIDEMIEEFKLLKVMIDNNEKDEDLLNFFKNNILGLVCQKIESSEKNKIKKIVKHLKNLIKNVFKEFLFQFFPNAEYLERDKFVGQLIFIENLFEKEVSNAKSEEYKNKEKETEKKHQKEMDDLSQKIEESKNENNKEKEKYINELKDKQERFNEEKEKYKKDIEKIEKEKEKKREKADKLEEELKKVKKEMKKIRKEEEEYGNKAKKNNKSGLFDSNGIFNELITLGIPYLLKFGMNLFKNEEKKNKEK